MPYKSLNLFLRQGLSTAARSLKWIALIRIPVCLRFRKEIGIAYLCHFIKKQRYRV